MRCFKFLPLKIKSIFWLVTRCGTRGHVCHTRQKCGLSSNFHAICNYLSAIMDGVTGRRGVMEEAGREIKPIIWAWSESLVSTPRQKRGRNYYISGGRELIRICYHCCCTIIKYDSCVKSLLWPQWPKCLNYTALCNLNWFYYAQYGSPGARTGSIIGDTNPPSVHCCYHALFRHFCNIFILLMMATCILVSDV